MFTTDLDDDQPDIYFSPAYLRAASIAERGHGLDVQAHSGRWRMPVIVRPVGDDAWDAITPAFSGIFAAPQLTTDQIRRAWADSLDELRRREIVSLVVRGSPVTPFSGPSLGMSEVSTGRPTVVLDLVDEDSVWTSLKTNCRSTIRKAERAGYTSTIRRVVRDDVVAGSDFRALYEGTMDRVGADGIYYFDNAYYDALLEASGAGLLIAEVRDPAGDIAAAGLFMRHGSQRIHYHLAGSRRSAAQMGANNLMIWQAIRHAIDEGVRHLHLGAAVAGQPGVLKFKSSFGGRNAPYDISGLVLDRGAYDELSQMRADELGVTRQELTATGFFPAYRATPLTTT